MTEVHKEDVYICRRKIDATNSLVIIETIIQIGSNVENQEYLQEHALRMFNKVSP